MAPAMEFTIRPGVINMLLDVTRLLIVSSTAGKFTCPGACSWPISFFRYPKLHTCLVALLLGLWLPSITRAANTATTPTVSIVAAPAGEPAAHGVKKMVAAFRDKNIPVEQVLSLKEAKGRFVLVAGLVTDGIFSDDLFKACRESVPAGAESLAIKRIDRPDKTIFCVAGRDSRGLMYAELDIAERIGWSSNAQSPLDEVRDAVETPDARTRAMSLYTMNRAYWESRFYDEAYWRRYLDTLAEDRFNSLVIIFGYENGGFLAPCYPYFFDVPEFPEVKMIGLTPEQQKQNAEALNRLIAMAHQRGIDVAIGIWDHIYRGGVQNGGSPGGDIGVRQPTPSLVWGMSAANLIPYTQAALKTFLKQFPIDRLQFRMHDESGLRVAEQSEFWRATFQTLKQTAPNLPVELRAKGLTSAEIQHAIDAGLNFCVNTKYWMEQMGLPFHPAHVNPADQKNRRHGYADLLVYPQQYKMKWQLWNGGTSRVLLWGDPEYARRFVESAHIYDSEGFDVQEPLATKMEAQPHDAKPFDLLAPSARYYDYEFERYWHWFQVFGRIGYNPDTPKEVFNKNFEQHFGADAGPIIESALNRASWILPRIIASSYPYSGFPTTVGWAERQSLGDLPTFARAALSDVQLFENFDEEARLLIENGETTKVRPQETSRWFARTADEVEMLIAEAEKKIGPRRNKEFDSTMVDLKMLASLACFHSQRILAAVSYRLFDRSKDPAVLDDAIAYERGAIAAWQRLVDAADGVYAAELTFGVRSRSLAGHWRDDLPMLQRSLEALETQRKNFAGGTPFTPSPRCAALTNNITAPVISHQPILAAPAGKPLTIRAKVTSPSGVKWVQVRYRYVDQTRDYETLIMTPTGTNDEYEAVIPGDKINPRFDFMYFIEAMDNQRQGVMYPDFNRQSPYFIVHLNR
jgi:hypothetical protein